MLVSLKWLKDYVDIDKTPADLADALTMAGLEVDEIKQIKPAVFRSCHSSNHFRQSSSVRR